MRRVCFLVLGVWLAGCPLPEDTFVVSGGARPNVEVRLFRAQVGSKTRCDVLEPLDVVTADAQGRFAFTVVRQQITGGENERRFFSVEFDGPRVHARRFWFPDADFELGEWVTPEVPPVRELRIDGVVAWRGADVMPPGLFDRNFELRTVTHGFEWKQVPIDSLGRFDSVPVESRIESPWERFETSMRNPPLSRGASCPFIDVHPCPLTDGRYLPFTLPPDSRTLVFNLEHEVAVRGLAFHGLVLARPAVKVRYDFNFLVDYDQWNPGPPSRVDPAIFDREAEHCVEPGTFLLTNANGIRPLIFRVSFEDADGNLIPIISLQEMSIR